MEVGIEMVAVGSNKRIHVGVGYRVAFDQAFGVGIFGNVAGRHVYFLRISTAQLPRMSTLGRQVSLTHPGKYDTSDQAWRGNRQNPRRCPRPWP